MPLAVGMYLPWTVTFPILIGGLAYLVVDKRSRRRGDSEEQHKRTIHRGLLFASGLVAGEAILLILIAIPMALDVDLPYMSDWLESGWLVTAVSLAALLAITVFLAVKALGRRE
jgi:hypothetical protein